MVSGARVLIDIASASQQVINASAAYEHSRSDRNVNLSRIRLGGQLHRIVAASQTLLNETLQIEDSSSHSVVHSRLTTWLSSDEPQECLDSLHMMEKLIRSSSRCTVSTFHKPFRVNSPEDKIKDAIQVLEKRKDYFYFLLTTDVWNFQTIDKDLSRLALVKRPESMVGIASVKGTDITEQDSVNHGQNVAPIKFNQTRFTIDQAQLDELLKWLNAWDCTSKHEDTLELRQPNTCTWLTDTIEYATWRNTDNSFLWLNGKPGSGKSVLAASVIDDVEKTLGKGEFLVFFYCDFRSERSMASAEVMRSLLSQLIRGLCDFGVDPGDILSDLFKEKRRKGTILANTKHLATFVSCAAKQFTRQPLMVIDALDECSDIESLLDALVSVTKGGIRLFVVSRPLQVIKDGFSGLEKILLSLERMSKEVSEDIGLHVAKEVDSHRRLRIVDPTLKEEISRVLCEKAGGMFRWVECQLITLKRCLTAVAIRGALESLPIGLEATYERIFLAMKKEDTEGVLARRALWWLVAALRPLRLHEVVEALSIDIERRALSHDVGPVHGPALLDMLGSLVTHDEATDRVILSHFSVKEYLATDCSHHINWQDAHLQLARQCMSYIAACLKLENGTSNALHPLLDYALSFGFHHLYPLYPNRAILDSIVSLDWDIQQHPSMWKLMTASLGSEYHWHLPSLEHDFVLYILIRYAREPLLRLFLSRSPLQAKEGTNPLIYVWQQPDYARILLSYGAKLNHPGRFVRDYGFGSPTGLPIEAAVRDGNRELLDLLIEEGSPVPRRLFSVAILEEDISISAHVVARLMQTDQFVEWATEIEDEVVVLRALDYHDEDYIPSGEDMLVMTRRLKQIGCDLTPHDFFVEDLFRQAVHTGHVSTIEYFLTEFEISLPSDILLSLPPQPLDGPGAPAIRCLLRHGADVHYLLPDDSTVLHHFIEQCRTEDDCLEATKISCKAGCDLSASNLRGDTPLHVAVRREFISVVKYLLSIGAPLPPDILPSLFLRLQMLCIKPSLKITHFLIREGADVFAVAPNGDTLLHLGLHPSIRGDHLERARMLVTAGCDPRVPNSLGRTPLELGVVNGQLPVVKYLLSTLDAPLPHNLLQFATSSCVDNLLMIRFLLAKGADGLVTSSDEHKALHRTLMAGIRWDVNDHRCFQVAKILGDSGCAQPYTCDCAGESLFHVIVHHRCSTALEKLLSQGVPFPPDILLAAHYEDLKTVQLLVKSGAGARVKNAYGDTPLHRAIRFSDPECATLLEFVDILITAGGDPSAANSSNRTPMHEAVDRGFLSVVNYFLSLRVPLPPDILLIAAKSYGCIAPKVRFLIDNGALSCTVTANGDNPLHLALEPGRSTDEEKDRFETTKILISAGCDVHAKNSAGETPLFVAAKAGHSTIVEYLLSQGEPLPHDILIAAASGCFKAMSTIRFLIGMGVNLTHVQAVASNGDTALHRAAETNFPNILQFFVDNGCDPLLRNLAGETPLHIAARHSHIPVVKYLLSIGVPLPSDVLPSVLSGDSFSYSTNPMIRLLVREGANLGAVNDNGDTPLHVLLRNDFSSSCNPEEKWEAIQILLNSGCNPDTRNRDGQTPADLAEAKGPFFLRNFLRLVKNAQNVRT